MHFHSSQHIQVSLSLIPTEWSRLGVAQVPRYRDLAIYRGDDRRTDKSITLPCTCARGNNYMPWLLPLRLCVYLTLGVVEHAAWCPPLPSAWYVVQSTFMCVYIHDQLHMYEQLY